LLFFSLIRELFYLRSNLLENAARRVEKAFSNTFDNFATSAHSPQHIIVNSFSSSHTHS